MRALCNRIFAIFLLVTILTGMVAFADLSEVSLEDTIPVEEIPAQRQCGLLHGGIEDAFVEVPEQQNLRLAAAPVDLEDVLLAGCLARQESINVLRFGIKIDDMGDLFYNFSMTHPEAFVATSYGYDWTLTPFGKVIVSIKPIYLCTKEELPQKQQEMEAFVDSYVAEAAQYKDSLEQILSVHDRLVVHCAYCTEAAEKAENKTLTEADYIYFHAYGLFQEGTVVCQGYAQAFYAIMKKMGYEVNYCYNSGHIWNYLKLDGKWYHLDATWDDPVPDKEGVASHTYFLKSDGAMTTHAPEEWKTALNELPVCDSTKYESGYMFNFQNRITIRKKNGKYQFDVATGPTSSITFSSDKLWTGEILATEPADGKIKFMFMKETEKPSTFYAAQKDKNGVLRGFGSIVLQNRETNIIYSCPLPPASDKVTSTEIYFRDGDTQKPTGPMIVY